MILSAPGGKGPLPLPPAPPAPPPLLPPLIFLLILSWEELRFWRPLPPISVAPPPRVTGGGDMLFARDGGSPPNGGPGIGLDPPAEPGIPAAPVGGGGRPGTGLFALDDRGGVREVPGRGGAPAGGFALDAAAPDAPPAVVEAGAEEDGLRTSTPPGRGGLTAVALAIPAPASRSVEMGAGRSGAGMAVSLSPSLMKAPRAIVKVLSFFFRFSSSCRSCSDGWGRGRGRIPPVPRQLRGGGGEIQEGLDRTKRYGRRGEEQGLRGGGGALSSGRSNLSFHILAGTCVVWVEATG